MNGPAAIRLLVADPQRVVRLGMTAMLQSDPGLRVVGEAATAADLVLQNGALRPDVIVTELRLEGVAVIEAIRACDPLVHLVVFTAVDSEEEIFRALKAGARGYLLKDADDLELVNAVRLVVQGRRSLTPRVAAKLASHLDGDPLSCRETEILQLLATGLPNKSIARRAEITEGTVKFHVNRILAKLNCATRTQAVSVALTRGLIRLN